MNGYHTGYLITWFSLLTTLVFGQQTGKGDRIQGADFVGRSPVLGRHGMVATSHPLATQIGLDVLKKGGSAVDAAIAANAALGVVEPNNGGIGGDLFAIIWSAKDHKLYGLNASGRSPKGLTYEALKTVLGNRAQLPLYGPLSVSVPGAVDGWFQLHQRFGKLPMRTLLAPSIQYAREGVPVPPVIAFSWQVAARRLAASQSDISEFANFRRTFLIDDKPPTEGQLFRNPDLANTYEKLAVGGRDAFYKGALADAMDAYARRAGLYLRKTDLATHQSTWIEPVSVNYRGYDVYELPPNGQGIAVLQMLNILEGFDLKKLGHNSVDYLHLLVEAKKLAFEDRARYYADPDFAKEPVTWLLSKQYATDRRKLIDSNRASERLDAGAPALRAGDTVYLTVADEAGNMVSLIQSNMLEFGSGMVPDGLGFVFHNRGTSFTMQPGHANRYAPGKRPFNTIIPGFVTRDGQPFLSFGVMGGAMQPQGHVQVLCNLIDFGMNVQEAGDAARFSHSGSSEPVGTLMTDGGRLALEGGIAPSVRTELERRGHHLAETDFFGGYQAIQWDPVNRIYWGASEMRKDGQAAGY
ncbi:gamma-glutamyltransferase [Spirosoma utsteinense]|uniref:Glutathione hydrolase proenzyme n=1 Tax=Spirosoma utsteinense TaxID=2585773 RepID=A0ABR6W6L6_9BACT|nr:gamma-glutamyltransferase [Spirosoma utsteinense]MBC3787539.1 gamma-glutamyltranspeptidase/glutathione hydrolase [Spirosoma utsteinense]MBC3792224.1 gamma-glutamyltranspeptidase/glutathione hydrolase [Spirosoma utsteinense]